MIPISSPQIGEEEKQAVLSVLDSGMLAQGRQVFALEALFTDLCHTRHAIATSSGTSALYLALLANGIGPGAEVITTPFTFIASVSAIIHAGATPVLVDIDEDTFNIDPSLIESAITPATSAILPVHLYGYPCDMDPIMEIANRHNLLVIEDAAQAVGATYKGKPVGSFGTGCFSLYATKNATAGEGGMITTDDSSIADRCRLLRSHGMRSRYHYETLGYNLRMSDIHAAIAVVQMGRLREFTAKRRSNAAYLSSHITTFPTPTVREGYDHAWHQYTIRAPGEYERGVAVQELRRKGIGTGIFYPSLVHGHAFIHRAIRGEWLPVADRLSQQVFSLPVHPGLTKSDLEQIVQAVNSLCYCITT